MLNFCTSMKKKDQEKARIQATLGPLVCVWFKRTDTIPWVKVYTMSPSLYHESKSITWVQVYTMSPVSTVSPSLCHQYFSIPCLQVYTMLHWLHFLSQLGYPVKKSHMSHMLRMSQGDGNYFEIFVCHQCFMGYTSLINDAIQLRNHTCHTC